MHQSSAALSLSSNSAFEKYKRSAADLEHQVRSILAITQSQSNRDGSLHASPPQIRHRAGARNVSQRHSVHGDITAQRNPEQASNNVASVKPFIVQQRSAVRFGSPHEIIGENGGLEYFLQCENDNDDNGLMLASINDDNNENSDQQWNCSSPNSKELHRLTLVNTDFNADINNFSVDKLRKSQTTAAGNRRSSLATAPVSDTGQISGEVVGQTFISDSNDVIWKSANGTHQKAIGLELGQPVSFTLSLCHEPDVNASIISVSTLARENQDTQSCVDEGAAAYRITRLQENDNKHMARDLDTDHTVDPGSATNQNRYQIRPKEIAKEKQHVKRPFSIDLSDTVLKSPFFARTSKQQLKEQKLERTSKDLDSIRSAALSDEETKELCTRAASLTWSQKPSPKLRFEAIRNRFQNRSTIRSTTAPLKLIDASTQFKGYNSTANYGFSNSDMSAPVLLPLITHRACDHTKFNVVKDSNNTASWIDGDLRRPSMNINDTSIVASMNSYIGAANGAKENVTVDDIYFVEGSSPHSEEPHLEAAKVAKAQSKLQMLQQSESSGGGRLSYIRRVFGLGKNSGSLTQLDAEQKQANQRLSLSKALSGHRRQRRNFLHSVNDKCGVPDTVASDSEIVIADIAEIDSRKPRKKGCLHSANQIGRYAIECSKSATYVHVTQPAPSGSVESCSSEFGQTPPLSLRKSDQTQAQQAAAERTNSNLENPEPPTSSPPPPTTNSESTKFDYKVQLEPKVQSELDNTLKQLEAQYDELVQANMASLLHIADNFPSPATIWKQRHHCDDDTMLRWSNVCISSQTPLLATDYGVFYAATLKFEDKLEASQRVNLLITQVRSTSILKEQQSHYHPMFLPVLTRFTDQIPLKFLKKKPCSDDEDSGSESPGKEDNEQLATCRISVLPRHLISSITLFAEQSSARHQPFVQALQHEKDVCFLLLQLITALKRLQAQGIEEISGSDFNNPFLVLRSSVAPLPQLVLVPEALEEAFENDCNKPTKTLSLCEFALRCVYILLHIHVPGMSGTGTTNYHQIQIPRLSRFSEGFCRLAAVLSAERSHSLSHAKAILEHMFWAVQEGISTVISRKAGEPESEMLTSFWLQRERAKLVTKLLRFLCQKHKDQLPDTGDQYHVFYLLNATARSVRTAQALLDTIA